MFEHGDIEPRSGVPIQLTPDHYQSVSEHRMVLVAWTVDSARHLLLREPDGTLVNLISTGDLLEGEPVTGIHLSTKAMPNDNTDYVELERQTETALWRLELDPLGGPGSSPLEIPITSGLGLVVMAILVAGAALWRLVCRPSS